MAGHKKAIIDKYEDYLVHKYGPRGWDIEVVKRVSNGTAGTWGIIHVTKPNKVPIIIRVHPWRGIDRVAFKGERYFKIKTLLTRKQVQYHFGYAPVPRPSKKSIVPYSDLELDNVSEFVGGTLT